MKKEDFQKDFQKVVHSAKILDVFLRNSSFKCFIHYANINPNVTSIVSNKDIKTQFIPNYKERKGIIFSNVIFSVEGQAKEDIKVKKKVLKKKGEVLFKILSQYHVVYEFNDFNVNKKAVEYFGLESSFFNVYPYLREYISHVSLRLNLPPVFIPLYSHPLTNSKHEEKTREKNLNQKSKKRKIKAQK